MVVFNKSFKTIIEIWSYTWLEDGIRSELIECGFLYHEASISNLFAVFKKLIHFMNMVIHFKDKRSVLWTSFYLGKISFRGVWNIFPVFVITKSNGNTHNLKYYWLKILIFFTQPTLLGKENIALNLVFKVIHYVNITL